MPHPGREDNLSPPATAAAEQCVFSVLDPTNRSSRVFAQRVTSLDVVFLVKILPCIIHCQMVLFAPNPSSPVLRFTSCGFAAPGSSLITLVGTRAEASSFPLSPVTQLSPVYSVIHCTNFTSIFQQTAHGTDTSSPHRETTVAATRPEIIPVLP
jgi:hypothetical protein